MSLEYKIKIADVITNVLKWKLNTSTENIASIIKINPELFKNKISYIFSPKTLTTVEDFSELWSAKNEMIEDVSILETKYEKYIQFIIDEKKFVKHILTSDLNSNTLFSYRKPLKCIVEFSSPNIAKPFHFGHLRSTIVGNFISNIVKCMNNKVIRINYLGDWGTQVGILNVGLKDLKLTNDEISKNPMKLLYKAYVTGNQLAEADTSGEVMNQARQIFRKMEFVQDTENPDVKNWKIFRKYTTEELTRVYARLGITFDEYGWESDYSAKRIQPLVNNLQNKNILIKNLDNASVIELENFSEPVLFLKSDETTLYISRDVAAAVDRYERYQFDRMIYVVDNAQMKHFKILIEILKKMGAACGDKVEHARFGFVLGMSTRKGTSVMLLDILKEIQQRTELRQKETLTTRGEVGGKTADILGISAVIINDLKKGRASNYKFDWDSALKIEGNTGCKLQYTHCRLCSLEENNYNIKIPADCDPDVLCEIRALNLVKEIARFEDAIIESYEKLEASVLVQYLFSLCNASNSALEKLWVKGENEHVASQRLLLFNKARMVLNEGMRILGLQPLNKM